MGIIFDRQPEMAPDHFFVKYIIIPIAGERGGVLRQVPRLALSSAWNLGKARSIGKDFGKSLDLNQHLKGLISRGFNLPGIVADPPEEFRLGPGIVPQHLGIGSHHNGAFNGEI
jgi:hypothetical protein